MICFKFSDRNIGQTMQTQIRLLLEEQSDQGLHCLFFHLHPLKVSHFGRTYKFEWLSVSSKVSDLEILTHISQVSFLWDMGKQNSPRCDDAKHGKTRHPIWAFFVSAQEIH